MRKGLRRLITALLASIMLLACCGCGELFETDADKGASQSAAPTSTPLIDFDALNKETQQEIARAALLDYAHECLTIMSSADIVKRYGTANMNGAAPANNYYDVRYMLSDITNDDIPELWAFGFNGDGAAIVLGIYGYENGAIKRLYYEYMGGAFGVAVSVVYYAERHYIMEELYSSGSGFERNVYDFEGGEKHSLYNSRMIYDLETGEVGAYSVNGDIVSAETYNAFVQGLDRAVVSVESMGGMLKSVSDLR